MAFPNISLTVLGLFIFLSYLSQLPSIASTSPSHVYIVYLGHNKGQEPLVTTQSHIQLLSNVFSKEEEAKEAMLYSYRHGFSGFAAIINSTQATNLSSMDGVISVFRSKALKLHTTRSWDFMGLSLAARSKEYSTLPTQLEFGDDVIVGVFDTGVWPELESFSNDEGMRPIPRQWKGTCDGFENVSGRCFCNRKLIGARYYLKGYESQFGPLNTSADAEYRSPRDRLGHGSHTASIAVGSLAPRASFYLGRLAQGTARGGAPRARLAVYKICWSINEYLQDRCTEADIMAAFDDALSDGVHVISASIGSPPPLRQLFDSGASIGSFHAMQLGVTVVFSAGNSGPESSLVENVAPWSICVAAGTIDRTYPTTILLGGFLPLMGEGFISKRMRKMRLVDGGRFFKDGSCSLDQWNRRRMPPAAVVLCFSTVGQQVPSTVAAISVQRLNASALIFAEPSTLLMPQDDLFPSVHVDLIQGTQILNYIKSCNKPTIDIFPSKSRLGRSPAPSVAYFSSRGPSSAFPNILKPDIAAPGVNILAAWSPKAPPTLLPQLDNRSVAWNFQSGTSMSCPHVSGIVALLKSAHPHWSPAAIRSALMTTAVMTDTSSDTILAGGTLKAADPFDIGAGHVDPLKAMDPGLIYDMHTQDYILFLCSVGYTEAQIRNIVLPNISPININTTCSDVYSDVDLNYPAIVISDLHTALTVRRTVTNIGSDAAIYFASVVSPQGVHVSISPHCLVFFGGGEKISYEVTVIPLKRSGGRYDFGEIVWFDGYHRVRIPLVVRVSTHCAVGGGSESDEARITNYIQLQK